MHIDHHQPLYRHGKEILESEAFQRAYGQTHHHSTSVALHSLEVAQCAAELCGKLRRIGLHPDERTVVIGALCHDLGILGRHEKYNNFLQCCFRHPIDSVLAAKSILPDLDDKTAKVISRHMFPATILPPTSLEGLIVSLADKYASIKYLNNQKTKSKLTDISV